MQIQSIHIAHNRKLITINSTIGLGSCMKGAGAGECRDDGSCCRVIETWGGGEDARHGAVHGSLAGFSDRFTS
jgi:hypothetical protein